jgi:hypothetical protein
MPPGKYLGNPPCPSAFVAEQPTLTPRSSDLILHQIKHGRPDLTTGTSALMHISGALNEAKCGDMPPTGVPDVAANAREALTPGSFRFVSFLNLVTIAEMYIHGR